MSMPQVPQPRTPEGAAALAALLSDPSHGLVALDHDGTLAPVVSRPEDAVAVPEAASTLARLSAVLGTVAVVTGRPAADAVRLGGLADVPGIVVLGHYGLQRWSGGELETPAPHPGVDALRPRLGAYAVDGVRLEDKGHSLALHTRGADDPQGRLDALREPVERLAGEAGLEVVPGRYVLELRPPGTDKGSALRALAAERGARVVVFAGDDLGDLPAVAAVHGLRAEGLGGLVVCSDSSETPAQLRDAADLVVDGPQGVMALLRALADAVAAR